MSYNNEIARLAIAILADQPEKGVNVRVSGGPNTLVIPEPHPTQSLTEAHSWRCPEMRPAFNLRLKTRCENGIFKAEIHKFLGIAHHPGNPDPFEVLDTIESASLETATALLADALTQAVPAGTKLGIDELIFQDRIFERVGEIAEDAFGCRRDQELESFVESVVDSGFELSMDRADSHFSLWLYPQVTRGWEILVTVTCTEAGFVILIQDRNVSENLIYRHRTSTKDDVKSFIARYFSRAHAFQFSELRVYRSGASPR